MRLSKNEYFINIADAVKLRSPDTKTQVGAVLVDAQDRIIGTGYNGPPAGFCDDSLDWDNSNGKRHEVYERTIHAELNSILYSGSRCDSGSKIYTTLSPCKDCMKIIAAAGIKTIIFKDRYKDYMDSKRLAREFNISFTQLGENDGD